MDDFYDKVYACWMGKNIGGTLGGPLEGRMELMDIKGYTQSFVESVENDDLDLQLVNLHCVEQYGGRADMHLLRKEWLSHVHFEFDEYGHALTNMRRGIEAPLSGHYNNFFTDCMGSPIRSEIWAVLCAGNPDLAAFYAYQDASVDHAGGEGVYGEIFFAVLESMAFVEHDKNTLIKKALSYLPETSVVRRAVELLLSCHASGMGWVEARQAIIDAYAGDNFTFAPVNIAFTLIGWLYEEGFTAQMLATIDCGYDTDCTVATLGSLLGILYGTKYLDPYWTEPLGEKILTSRPITGFHAPATIAELTERSIAARELVQKQYALSDPAIFKIDYFSDAEQYFLPLGSLRDWELEVRVKRVPAMAPGAAGEIEVWMRNALDIPQELSFVPEAAGYTFDMAKAALAAGETKTVTLHVRAPKEKSAITRGRLAVRRTINGVAWDETELPLTMLPTMDWRCGDRILCQTENRITAQEVHAEGDTVCLSTTLTLANPGRATLKLVCANPLKIRLDGKCVLDCPKRTIVIPAYHRADPCKSIKLPETPGTYRLTVEIGDAASFTGFYWLIVTEDFWWAYRTDSVFACE